MLAVQEQRISLELKQADITIRELDHNQKIADKTIEAQANDRKDERSHQREVHRDRLVFAGIMGALLVAFVLAALYMNKEALVIDVIKVLVGFLGGWGASIAWHRRTPTTKSDQED
jgi:hypothetical protein